MKILLLTIFCFAGWNVNAQYNRPPYGSVDAKTLELEKPSPSPVAIPIETMTIEETAEQPDKTTTPVPPATKPVEPPTQNKPKKNPEQRI
ncbi:MAG TPA: hypothetical protein PKY29_06750 [Ferruginibacter sp.]|nr:hypothetical protein [Ferruginibacter sp.]HRO16874.1 hypothetical protein [Ferruginibacter sp.]HRQ20997.1 hypothetical protein [Ferruginibacter sp.]